MKTNLIVIAVAMFLSVAARAQENRGHHGNQAEKMRTVLALDEKQYASIKGINEKFAKRAEALKTTGTEVDRAAIHSLRQERRKEVEAVLTPEQQQKWITYKKERAEERKANYGQKNGRGKHMHREHSEKMKTELGLTDQQAEKLKQAHQDFRSKMRGLHEESKTSGTKDAAAYEKAKADHKEAVRAILTQEQFEKWLEYRKQRQAK